MPYKRELLICYVTFLLEVSRTVRRSKNQTKLQDFGTGLIIEVML